MSAQVLDGTSVAQRIRDEVRIGVAAMSSRGRRPGLAVILVGEDPASTTYVRSKERVSVELGILAETRRLPVDTTTDALLEVIHEFNTRAEFHGVLVQTPLPRTIDTRRVLDAVDAAKDVDGFHPDNVGRLVQKRTRFAPCTPAGIMELLRQCEIPVAGRRAVVVGRSDIVGKPMATLLMHADATVTVCHSRTADLAHVTREADIVVAAIGREGLITARHLRPGAVVIDVGMNRVADPVLARELAPHREAEFAKKGYVLVGDVHPGAWEVAGALTPVPGGVGPLTVAMLMKNTLLACQQAG